MALHGKLSTVLCLTNLLLVQVVWGKTLFDGDVSVSGELKVGKLNKPLMQELREIDMGNFLDPPNIGHGAAVGEDGGGEVAEEDVRRDLRPDLGGEGGLG